VEVVVIVSVFQLLIVVREFVGELSG
jgi:hypothetical protein